ncbi:MAG: DoxX family membrane protein [Actinobacteria bacterium]|uniref:Unannotated protein n=1 Tax=freshwater metagenome TaxID=449393 RepID=A0A6J7J7M8_9ZZZZ|nr:DoxX family membrane protein [Actinomycetota bacterium]
MSFTKISPWLTLVSRLLVGGVLVVAGYLKVGNTAKSQMAVRAYEVLPISIANTLGVILPWLEIGAGLLLILGVAVKWSSIFAAALMFIFIAAIAQAWARGLSIDCGCFGGGGQVAAGKTRYLEEILRDLGLAITAIYLIRYPLGRFGIERSKAE